ncbi:NlpC/P60 family protein [Pseudodesulfovibrio sp. JC047]|uniref:C40 family peptidase n=1 Tax=Pseudodesulfovibrio sp. JC047 TaxID=2683199 RepID=UPI001EF3A02E|nr:NlpC/P60 family protein [Pseudodesulfovibrio sp. JC047]
MFSPETIRAAQEHARAEYPREACGLVVDGAYLPRTNTVENPLVDFRISPQGYAAAARRGEIQAVIHSHPDGPDHPSRADMIGQVDSGLAWGIVPVLSGAPQPPFFWGGNAPIPELIGRRFRHGVADCYALVRDWFRQERDDVLPEYPRDDEWWLGGGNLLMDNIQDAGFEVVDGDPQVGDMVFLQICASVPNHCGVYLGDGLLLHHLVNRFSRVEPLNRWRKHIRLFIRRVPS